MFKSLNLLLIIPAVLQKMASNDLTIFIIILLEDRRRPILLVYLTGQFGDVHAISYNSVEWIDLNKIWSTEYIVGVGRGEFWARSAQ